MNKHQEALNKIKNYEFQKNSWVYNIGDKLKSETNILQELVDKETPMKPNYETCEERLKAMSLFGIDAWCDECTAQLSKEDVYCRICGQRIDWGQEDE